MTVTIELWVGLLMLGIVAVGAGAAGLAWGYRTGDRRWR
jgi:hypothetical protein